MTRDLDDDAIAQLVRDAAAGWTMPALRLDAPSWRERIRGSRARRMAATRGWFGRFGQAATAAVALTVVAALVAVVITRPTTGPGKSPEATPGTTPGASRAAASLLPSLLLEGELPTPAIALVRTEGGFYANVDLATGKLGAEFTMGGSGSAVQRQADGSVLCLCNSESARVNGAPTVAAVMLERYGPDGSQMSSIPIETFTGKPDPRDPASTDFNYPPHVLVTAGFTADGRFGLVGWSLRDHPAWRSGILLVDLLTGFVMGRLELPDVTTGDGSARRVVQAPRVVGDAGSGRVVVARTIETSSSPDPQAASVVADVDVFTVAAGSGEWADLAPVAGSSDCGYAVLHAGTTLGGLWLACVQDGTSNTVVRRFARDGTRLDDIVVGMGIGTSGDTVATNADGSVAFAWDPTAARLTRIDLATGATTIGTGDDATAAAGPWSALGDWLAPTAAAKSVLSGALVVSPEGDRVYAIGVAAGSGRELTGSSGIYAFDSTSMTQLAHWQPTADYVSLAVSLDGRFVYATGLPGVDAAGREERRQGASVTVFDASSGDVRVLAGQLGSGMLDFPVQILE